MRTTLAVAAVLFIATPAAAEPMLIAAFKWTNPEPVTLPAEYVAIVYTAPPAPDAVRWSEIVSAFPYSSVADPAMVAQVDALLIRSPLGEIRFINGGQTFPGPCGWCQLRFLIGDDREQFLPQVTAAGFEAERLVPRRGINLYGYEITGIERTITASSQTIRMYGIERDVTVPEPASWLLACLALCWFRRQTQR